MKIAVIINELNIRGGTHKQVLRLCQYLQKKGETVTIYTRAYEKEKTYPEFDQFKIVVVGSKALNECGSSRRNIWAKIKKMLMIDETAREVLDSISIDTDVVNVHDMGFQRVMYLAKKRRNCVVVWQINDLPTCFRVGFAQNINDSITLKVQRYVERHLAKKIDRITVNVTKNRDNIEHCYRKKADVFYCGVDLNVKLQRHVFKNSGCIKLLTIGVFYPHRNYESMIKVMDKMVKENINIHLDIIGSTQNDMVYSDKIKEMIKERKLQNHITIWGQVDDETYASLFNEADIFTFLNVNQSWGLAVFEAMSCGLPTLVSDSVGAIELLENEKDSIIIDPFDIEKICNKIIYIMNNPEYYNKLANNAYEVTRKFTWDELYSSKMKELFYQLREEQTEK